MLRLVYAGIISGSGLYGTHRWYQSVANHDEGVGTQKAIAKIIDLKSEVQRKRQNRASWLGIQRDSELAAGDSVRTGPDSGARIEFNSSHTVVELDADSLVVIEENQGKLALDFLKGNLFVRDTGAGGAEPGQLTVKSGSSSIAVNGADVALNKENAGDMNVQVFRGSSQVTSGGKSSEINTEKSMVFSADGTSKSAGIEILAPSPLDPVFVTPGQPRPVSFQWRKLTADYSVSLETGPSNSALGPSLAKPVAGSAGAIELPVKVGSIYWRLSATSKDAKHPPIASRILKLEIRPRTPPLAVSPASGSVLGLKSDRQKIRFLWANPAHINELRFEVAKKIDGSDSVLVKNLPGRETGFEMEFKEPGVYYWRVSGLAAGKMDLAGEFAKLTLQSGEGLLAPVLVTPVAGQRLPFLSLQDRGLYLIWAAVEGAKGYRVTLQSPSGNQSFDIDGPPLKLKTVGVGNYKWSVAARESESKDAPLSKASEVRGFDIIEVKKINWTGVTTPEDVVWYHSDKPQATLSWNGQGLDSAKAWRIRVAPVNQVMTDSSWVKTTATNFTTDLPSPGLYQAEVEGLDAKDLVLAKSPSRKFALRLIPAPTAPKFTDQFMPDIYKATGFGDVALTWTPIDRATGYLVRLQTPSGLLVKEFQVNEPKSALKQLMPGNYHVLVFTQDAYGRRSPASEVRSLEVPATNGLGIPKLKKIKIK